MRDRKNRWMEMVGHRGCIFPCYGHPVLMHRPRKVRVAADTMPAYLACSECGYTPLPKYQPKLVAAFLRHWNRKNQPKGGS